MIGILLNSFDKQSKILRFMSEKRFPYRYKINTYFICICFCICIFHVFELYILSQLLATLKKYYLYAQLSKLYLNI